MRQALGARRSLLVAALVAALVGTVGLAVLGRQPAPTAMQLVVSPHPDDELQGWAKLSRGDRLFTVFVVMTGGEATGNCNGAPNLQDEYGERPPRPLPGEDAQATRECVEARIDSWHAFLDLAAETLPAGEELADLRDLGTTTLGPVEGMDGPVNRTMTSAGEPAPERVEGAGEATSRYDLALDPSGLVRRDGETPAEDAHVWLGEHTARVVLDVGDTDVHPSEVEWAIRAVLDRRGEELPDLPLERLVATAYVNDSAAHGENTDPPGCHPLVPCEGDPRDYEYEHPDHAAVNEAVESLAGLAGDGSWLVTYPHDAAADARHALSRDTYDELMGLGERMGRGRKTRERLGAHQVAYGWLSFPGPVWPTGRTATAERSVLFPRVQYFRHVQP